MAMRTTKAPPPLALRRRARLAAKSTAGSGALTKAPGIYAPTLPVRVTVRPHPPKTPPGASYMICDTRRAPAIWAGGPGMRWPSATSGCDGGYVVQPPGAARTAVLVMLALYSVHEQTFSATPTHKFDDFRHEYTKTIVMSTKRLIDL